MKKQNLLRIYSICSFLFFSWGAMAQTSNEIPNPTKQKLPLSIPKGHQVPLSESQTMLDEKLPPDTGAIIPPPIKAETKTLPPAASSRENFYASMKERLGKEEVKIDNLKARFATMVSNRTPENDKKLTSMEAELKGLHDTINGMSTVKDGEFSSLQNKITQRFNNLERDLNSFESQIK